MKNTHPHLWLLLIPLAIILSIALIALGTEMEIAQAQELVDSGQALGHASGFSVLITLPISIILTLVLTIVGIVKTVKGVKKKKAAQLAAQEGTNDHGLPPEWQ